jgi:L-alanine-DL-glutamate epimerase-like enolase superfamily enzyme
MKLSFRRFDLALAHRWAIASGAGGTNVFKVAFVELRDRDGVVGLGEAAPSSRYDESVDSMIAFLKRVDASRLSFDDVPGSMKYLDSVADKNFAPKCALNVALLDGGGKKANQPIYDLLKLGFSEGKHITSFSIGLDRPEIIRQKVAAAEHYPVLKLKVGGPNDRENLAALREVAPKKIVRVDANEAWKTRDEALKQIEWLAKDRNIEFVEQPMPANTSIKDMAWLKSRSPLPIMADESYLWATDVSRCAECDHAVNVKLVKTGGISGAYEALRAARKAGLKTMIGCMIESSILISAAAHLAALTDYLDIDGNLLITNDPYLGASARNGIISFDDAPEKFGLRISDRG